MNVHAIRFWSVCLERNDQCSVREWCLPAIENAKDPSGKHVVLEIDVPEEGSPEEILQLATHVYEGLSDSDIDEVEAIAFDRSNFFSNREGEWPNE